MFLPELQSIFDTLCPFLARYRPPLVSKHDDTRYYELWSQKDPEIAERKRRVVFFAELINEALRSGYTLYQQKGWI